MKEELLLASLLQKLEKNDEVKEKSRGRGGSMDLQALQQCYELQRHAEQGRETWV